MRRRQGEPFLFRQRIQQRHSEGRALLRIGARAEFVEKNERRPVRLFQNGDDVLDVGAEGGQVLLDALLVADVRENGADVPHPGVLLRRNRKTAPREVNADARGFEDDRLSARIRACDHKASKSFAALDVHGDGLIPEEGMPRLVK